MMSGQVRINAASTTNGWCLFDVVKKLTNYTPSDTNDTLKRLKKLDKQVRIMVIILLHMRFSYAYRWWFRFTG